MAPRKPRNLAAAAEAVRDPELEPLPPPNGAGPDDGDDGDDDGDDDDSGEGDGDDGDDGGDDDNMVANDARHASTAPLQNGFRELPPQPRHTPPLVEVPPAPRARSRASGGPAPSPNPRGIRGPRNMSDADRANSPALRSVQRYQEAAYAEIDSLLATLNFSTRQYEVRVSRFEPETDENGVPCTGLLHTYKQKVTVDQIQQRFGGGLYEVKVWGPHPTSGRPAIIKQETFPIAGHPKPMPSHKEEARESKNTEISEIMRTIADSNERSQERVLSLMEKQNANKGMSPQEIAQLVTQTVTQALAQAITPLVTKSDADKAAELEARRAEREDRQRQDDKRREDEKAERERLREEAKERREEERRAEERRREEDKNRREEERRAEDKKREEDRERREEERRAEDKKREEERERQKEEREKERERAKEDAAEKQRIHEREMAALAERTKADADRQKEFMTMMNGMTNHHLEILSKRNENGGLEAIANNLRLLKDLKDDVNDRGGEPTKMEVFNEGVQSFVNTVAPIAKQIGNAINKNGNGGQNQQQRQQGQQNQQPQQNPQQNQQAPVAGTVNGQPVAAGQTVVVDIGPARRALPAGGASGGMAVPQAQPTAPVAAQGGAMQPVQQQPQAPAPQQAEPQPGDGEPNDLTEFVWASEGDAMLDVGTKLLKDVDLAIQRNMTSEQIVDQILDPFDQVAPMLMSMASGMSSDELVEFISGNVPSTWAILSPRGEELVVKAFEIWNERNDQGGDD